MIGRDRSELCICHTKRFKKKNLLCCTLIVVCTGQPANASTQPPAQTQPQVPDVSRASWIDEWLLPGHSPSPANGSAAVSAPVFRAAATITPAAVVVPPVQPATAPVTSQLAEQMMPITPAAVVPPVSPTTPVMSQPADQMMPERMEVDSDSDSAATDNGMRQTMHANNVMPVYLSSDAPATSHVPQKLKTQIVNGEYIELSKLFRSDAPLEQDQVLVVKNGVLKFEATPKKTDIYSFSRFFDCFSIFMTIRGNAFPREFPMMLKHLETVKRLFAQGNDGGLYDKRFRITKADNPHLPWGMFMAEFVSPRQSSEPKTQSQATKGAGQSLSNPKSCFYFNAGKCNRTNCKFPHICSVCKDKSHGKIKCTKK